jgi:hypothetical protein
MHRLAPAGKVVLAPGVALTFVTPEVIQNHLSRNSNFMVYAFRPRWCSFNVSNVLTDGQGC